MWFAPVSLRNACALLSAHCVDETAAIYNTAAPVANFAKSTMGSIEPIAYPSKILNQGAIVLPSEVGASISTGPIEKVLRAEASHIGRQA